jgi:hypothetical protein
VIEDDEPVTVSGLRRTGTASRHASRHGDAGLGIRRSRFDDYSCGSKSLQEGGLLCIGQQTKAAVQCIQEYFRFILPEVCSRQEIGTDHLRVASQGQEWFFLHLRGEEPV